MSDALFISLAGGAGYLIAGPAGALVGAGVALFMDDEPKTDPPAPKKKVRARLPKDRSGVVSVLVDKDRGLDWARAWAKKHGFKDEAAKEEGEYIHLPQREAGEFQRVRTRAARPGVLLRIGFIGRKS